MILILLHDDTWYLLNIYVQSIGYYLQNILQLGFHTGKSKFNSCKEMKTVPFSVSTPRAEKKVFFTLPVAKMLLPFVKRNRQLILLKQ